MDNINQTDHSLEFRRFWFEDNEEGDDKHPVQPSHDTLIAHGCADLRTLIDEKSDETIESCLRTTMPADCSADDYRNALFIIQKIERLRVQYDQFEIHLKYCNCTRHSSVFKQSAIHTVRAFKYRFKSKDALKSFFQSHEINDDSCDKIWNCIHGNDANLMKFRCNEGRTKSHLFTLIWFKSEIQSKLMHTKDLRNQSELGRQVISYPVHWVKDESAEEQKQLQRMHKEARFCPETAKIAHMFLERAKNVQIINIESIENKYLFDQYYDQKQLVLKYVGADKLNERYLFHGTTQQAMADIVQDGFRKEYSMRARFCEGT
eukprot:858784_1